MDRTAAAVIVLGIFLGSVYSFSLEASRPSIPWAVPQDSDNQRGDSGKLLAGAESDEEATPTAPSKVLAERDLGYVPDSYEEATRGDILTEGWDGEDRTAAQATPPAYIAVGDDGIFAHYADSNMTYKYSGYVLALVRIQPSAGAGPEEALATAGAIIVDATESSLLVLVPEGQDDLLASLVKEGTILSYELGGMGTGLGKA